MKTDKQWYIVYTHTGNEIKTLYALHKKHVECFCPMTAPATRAKHKPSATPLLPNYLFVHIAPSEQTAVRQVEGIVNFMYWLGNCVVVSDEDIFILKELTEKYQSLTVEKIKIDSTVPVNDRWQYATLNNNTNFDAEQEFVKVSFPAYGFAVTAAESKMNIRVININNRTQQRKTSIEYSE